MTDAPEAPRQEREALARLMSVTADPDYRVGEDYLSDLVAYRMADAVLTHFAGYVTPEAHAAALREAWEAGRDAVIAEAERGAGEIELLLEPTDAQRNKQFALLQLAANATALTPPAPKGDAT